MHVETVDHPLILLHGGAGAIHEDTPRARQRNEERETVLGSILRDAATRYQQGDSALDLVEFCVRAMEDSPLFNAGIGSVLTEQGWVEMDASIMDGATQKAGAVALLRRLRHPISAARFLMDHSPYVFLAGPDAEQWFVDQGLETIEPARLITAERKRQWEKATGRQLDHSAESGMEPTQTVGAVAIDRAGNLAAATSTGGMMRKAAGRIGDSALIGAGTFADNRSCAVSTTGEGEFFIRGTIAAAVHCSVTLQRRSLQDAVVHALEHLQSLGGNGGLIALTPSTGVFAFTTAGMYRAYLTGDQRIFVGSLQQLREFSP